MNHRRRELTRRKTDLAWCLLGFVCATLLLDVIVDWRCPDLYDAEYGVRLALLKTRLAEHPGCPLLLAIGSSRIGEGFDPEILPSLSTPSGERVLPFNFSHLSAGPIL